MAHWYHQSMRMKYRAGFTAIEIIIVLAIFIIAIAMTLPFLGALQQTTTIDTLHSDAIQTLHRARNRSMSNQHNSEWGVAFTQEGYVLYAGESYRKRNTRFDEIHRVSTIYKFSPLEDIHFSSLYGNSSGAIISISQEEAGTRTVIINDAGTVLQQ